MLTGDYGRAIAAMERALVGLGNAWDSAAQARARARTVRAKAAQTGFAKIAASVGTFTEQLEEVQRLCDEVATSVRTKVSITHGVAGDTNPGDVVATLTVVLEGVDDEAMRTVGLVTKIDSVKTEVAVALRGGKPGPMLSILGQITHPLREVIRSLGTAREHAERAINMARQIGLVTGSDSSDIATVPPPRAPAQPASQLTGPRSNCRRPAGTNYEALWQWAEDAYDNIRASEDADKIANHLTNARRHDGTAGFSSAEIREIRQHLFFATHLLESHSGKPSCGRFDPDEDIADAWLRLRTGKAIPEDVVLLEHELAEARYLREHPRATYREAHRAANRVANWERRIPAATREDFNADWR